ncbi:DUF4337 domain-containing protein [Paenibacillus filicis]|uniref:DUF4337 domain-containing protein n=1 Tax=Paenibacillus gyeongsangnamensis TaxID=3388067 RepID=A0ABT4QIP2_9BACL|nr:DUF4337 domain-containing protein [Paenibacillus filicis]MCZ8516718.1 DUF4337 domain-containing protein [Paenibacillus filicis]
MEENFGIENPLEKVEEEVKELEEKEEQHRKEEAERSKFNNWIAITISIYAVFTALGGMKESQVTTDTLLQMDQAVLLQAQASDQWAFYQAKSIKGELYKTQSQISSLNSTPAASALSKEFDTNTKRYDAEKNDIQTKANELEKQRDEKMKETSDLVHKHHNSGMAIIFLQIAIVLASVSSLLKKKVLWFGSIGIAAIGLIYLVPLLIK